MFLLSYAFEALFFVLSLNHSMDMNLLIAQWICQIVQLFLLVLDRMDSNSKKGLDQIIAFIKIPNLYQA
jgi:hypothetical protein